MLYKHDIDQYNREELVTHFYVYIQNLLLYFLFKDGKIWMILKSNRQSLVSKVIQKNPESYQEYVWMHST